MKYISTIISIIALAGVVVLYVNQSKQAEQLKKHSEVEKKDTGTGFKIAYFDMDSVEAHYDYFKDAQFQVKQKENKMNEVLTQADRDMQKKIAGWRQKSNTMTQAEGEQAQREYADMQQQFQVRKQTLEQEMYKTTEDLKANIRKKIEDYLKDYNKQKNYTYILAYDAAGAFIYNKDTTYNITADLIEGLNAEYKKKK